MKFFILLVTVGVALGARLPEGTKLCRRSDPTFQECLKDAITDGFKRFSTGFKPLGFPNLDPIPISELSTGGAGGLSQTYKNIKITGLAQSTIEKLKMDFDSHTLECVILTPHSEMTADYIFKGELISFPLDASGKAKLTFKDIRGTHNVKFEDYEKDGKKHIRILDWKIKISPKEVHYDFENIMPGNKQLSETILQTMNENAVQIFLDQAPAFEEAYGLVHKTYANKVFDKIPISEIFLP